MLIALLACGGSATESPPPPPPPPPGQTTYTDVSATHLPAVTRVGNTMEARTADLDGDGNRDVIIVAEDDSAKMLLFGDGRGAFTDVTNRLDRRCVSNAVVAGDIDRDDDADIIYGCAGPDRVLINDGAGNFTDESAARLPPHPGGPAVVRSRIRVDSA